MPLELSFNVLIETYILASFMLEPFTPVFNAPIIASLQQGGCGDSHRIRLQKNPELQNLKANLGTGVGF